MRFLHATVVSMVLLALLGCSAQATLYQLTELPSQARFSDRFHVVNPPRFRLPPSASMAIADKNILGKGRVPQPWLLAGNRGLQSIFTSTTPRLDKLDYELFVDWPETTEPAHSEVHTVFKAGLFGVMEMPKIPEHRTLKLRILDNQGALVANMALEISPRWWGDTWSNAQMLEASFGHLADVLVGR